MLCRGEGWLWSTGQGERNQECIHLVLSSEADIRGVATYAVLWHDEQKTRLTVLSFESC